VREFTFLEGHLLMVASLFFELSGGTMVILATMSRNPL
jgi:hypothetical protein